MDYFLAWVETVRDLAAGEEVIINYSYKTTGDGVGEKVEYNCNAEVCFVW